MTVQSEQPPSQESPIVEVLTYPLEQDVYTDMDDNYSFTKRGVLIEVVLRGDDEPVRSKEVWQRGTLFPRPFYEQRLTRALDKASRFAGALSVRHSTTVSQFQE